MGTASILAVAILLCHRAGICLSRGWSARSGISSCHIWRLIPPIDEVPERLALVEGLTNFGVSVQTRIA